MAKLKFLSAAVLAAAMLATPAMARQHHAISRAAAEDAYASVVPAAPYGAYYTGGYRCVPAPRVGAFASAPWTNSTPCEPGSFY
ncbi:hypothetical protein [Bradyrhizobium sp. STM 3562]|uniref:hypothetical protein n=1 Tax=Bradyrhizobium sp. STM 3562 TaxID=578924 RepID=UPI00388DF85F